MAIRVVVNGPYLVSGGIPLSKMMIISDAEGTATEWRVLETYSPQEGYALCRCGQSSKKPFCDGTHAKTKFHGKETADESYLDSPETHDGPSMRLTDFKPLCASARFCHRAGGIWELIRSDAPQAKALVIQESADCPSGRLVVNHHGENAAIEPSFVKSIAVVEDPAGGGLGPYWVRGGIPVVSSKGKAYMARNRLTLCRCGKSRNKPFCDSSHYSETLSKR